MFASTPRLLSKAEGKLRNWIAWCPFRVLVSNLSWSFGTTLQFFHLFLVSFLSQSPVSFCHVINCLQLTSCPLFSATVLTLPSFQTEDRAIKCQSYHDDPKQNARPLGISGSSTDFLPEHLVASDSALAPLFRDHWLFL